MSVRARANPAHATRFSPSLLLRSNNVLLPCHAANRSTSESERLMAENQAMEQRLQMLKEKVEQERAKRDSAPSYVPPLTLPSALLVACNRWVSLIALHQSDLSHPLRAPPTTAR